VSTASAAGAVVTLHLKRQAASNAGNYLSHAFTYAALKLAITVVLLLLPLLVAVPRHRMCRLDAVCFVKMQFVNTSSGCGA
jgi:hypothetical protein